MKRIFKIDPTFMLLFVTAAICATNGYIQPVTGADDYKPVSTNQQGKQYPQVNGAGRVRASIPGAAGTKSATGYWP